jgi:hypothetical protein
MRFLLFVLVLLFFIGTVEGSPSVHIASPLNETLFNHTIEVNVSSNETIGANNWTYILDGGGEVRFSPNITIEVTQGAHNLTIIADNGSVNETNATFFTAAFIIVQFLDVETEINISDGINVKILSEGDVVLKSNTTNTSGGNKFQGLAFNTYKVQGGGPAGSLYPHIYTYSFDFTEPNTSLEVLLPQSTACQFVTYQYIDSFYGTALSDVSVRIKKGGKTLTDLTSDTNGFVTVCLVPGLSYVLDSSRSSYISSNFTDNAVVSSQFIQLVRETLATVTDAPIDIHTYPEEITFFKNDTIFFGLWIHDSGSALEEYRITYGRSPEIIKDEGIASQSPGFKQLVAIGSNAQGEYLTCVETNRCLNVRDWEGGVIYVGYYYKRLNEEPVWIINKLTVSNDLIRENFWTNWTAFNNPKDQVHLFFASIGYGPEPDGSPSMGMINFSIMVMVFAAIGAARNNWGIMGAMIAFMGANAAMITLGLIQWWTILISITMVVYLGNRFGSVFT